MRCARRIVEDARADRLEVRSGAHTGEVERAGADVAGAAVHLAARIMGCAEGGEVLCSRTVKDLVVGSELRFVGDSNAVEPSGASSRHGYELVAFWRPLPWLAFDGNYTASHSRYDNGAHIPNAFKNAASAGAALVLDPWEASIRLRHLGPSPLIDDNSVRDSGSTVVNARAAWKGKRVQLYGEVLNILASKDKDIAYYYESYIPSFDTGGPVEGRLSRVVEPRTFRLGAKITF